jgi:hypothetical protein
VDVSGAEPVLQAGSGEIAEYPGLLTFISSLAAKIFLGLRVTKPTFSARKEKFTTEETENTEKASVASVLYSLTPQCLPRDRADDARMRQPRADCDKLSSTENEKGLRSPSSPSGVKQSARRSPWMIRKQVD